jgi:ribose 5-phosphate isomerase A
MNSGELKKKAAEKAIEFVESGMVLGLGTGSTVHFALLRLGELIADGALANIIGIPTSRDTELKAQRLGIPVSTLDDYPKIDLVIDGADEVDPAFNLIKGGGGALLREKIIAQASNKFIVVVDESKLSVNLFTKFKLPVEVIKLALRTEKEFLLKIGGEPCQRVLDNGEPFITDEGNYILDTKFKVGVNPAELNVILNERAGIAAHGLFIGLADEIVVGREDNIELLGKNKTNAKIL